MSDYHLIVPGPKVCSQCGSWEDLQVHHKNGNHSDDRPENLEWRCREKCHSKVHRRYIPPLKKSMTPQSQRFERENNDLSFSFKPNFR